MTNLQVQDSSAVNKPNKKKSMNTNKAVNKEAALLLPSSSSSLDDPDDKISQLFR